MSGFEDIVAGDAIAEATLLRRERRERIAVAAMVGLLASPRPPGINGVALTSEDHAPPFYAVCAVAMADALIRELDRA